MDIPVRFGLAWRQYTFPAGVTQLSDNFKDVRQSITRIPGASGGSDDYGMGVAPTEVGNVTINYFVRDYTRAQITAELDALGEVVDFGKAQLFKQPTDLTQEQRYCWARLSSAPLSQAAREQAHKNQKFSVTFQVNYPFWMSRTGQVFLDDGWDFDTGVVLTAPQIDREVVNASSTVSVTNYGNAPAPCLVRWDVDTGHSVVNPSLTMYARNGSIAQQIVYADTLSAHDVVEIDSRARCVCPSYGKLSKLTGEWFVIPPGTSTIYVGGTFTTEARLTINWKDTWR